MHLREEQYESAHTDFFEVSHLSALVFIIDCVLVLINFSCLLALPGDECVQS